jgi:hypothetical protein
MRGRTPRSVRRAYALTRRAGIGVLVVAALAAAMFPGEIKEGARRVADLLRGLSPEESTEPAPVIADDALLEPEPRPAPMPIPPPPPPPPAIPAGPPRVAVIGVGDPRVADRLGSLLQGALQQHGLGHVEGGGNSLGIRDLVGQYRGAPPTSQVASVLAREGYTAAVLAEGMEVASRELEFYGRRDVATKWRVRVSAFRLRDQMALGSGWSGEVETTERGALATLEHFLDPIAAEVVPAVEAKLGGP